MALSLIVELMKLHDKNVYGGVHIHNDIKPENIMITEEGLARFIDFGLSSDKKEPFIGGTSAYLSPEFFNYVQRPSPRPYKSSKVSHDIYSLGLVLFQIFMELPPFFDSFPAKSDKAKRWNHRQPYYTNGPIIKVVTDIYP